MNQNMVMIIDLMNAAHRMRHVHGDLKTSKGRYTGVVFGFMAMMDKLLREFKPGAVIVANESTTGTKQNWRKDLYPAYKGDRAKRLQQETEEDSNRRIRFMQQEVRDDLLGKLLPGLGIPVVDLPAAEADDVIGYLTERASSQDIETLIVSTDTDMVQLVNPRGKNAAVRVFAPTTDKMYYAADLSGTAGEIKDSTGKVHACSWLNYQWIRAAVGDPSDSIKGINSIGKGRAAKLFEIPARTGELLSVYMARCRRMFANGTATQPPFWDRLEAGFPILLRNIALMALRGTATQYSRKKIEAAIDPHNSPYHQINVMQHIWNEKVLPCVSANDGSTIGQLVRSRIDEDPSAFLNFFRSLEFEIAMSPAKSRKILQQYKDLADSSENILTEMFASEIRGGTHYSRGVA